MSRRHKLVLQSTVYRSLTDDSLPESDPPQLVLRKTVTANSQTGFQIGALDSLSIAVDTNSLYITDLVLVFPASASGFEVEFESVDSQFATFKIGSATAETLIAMSGLVSMKVASGALSNIQQINISNLSASAQTISLMRLMNG